MRTCAARAEAPSLSQRARVGRSPSAGRVDLGRWHLALLVGVVVGLAGCSTKEGVDSAGGGEGSEGGGVGGDGGGDGGSDGGTDLDNGPGGSLIMVNSCAPDDGPALSLVIGLGSACDMGAPDPTTPYVRMNVHDGGFVTDPVGTTASWEEHGGGSIWYAPEGESGVVFSLGTGTVHLDAWEGADGARPEGGAVSGWYVLQTDDGTEVGNSFSGVFCGGEPLCG